ASLLASGAQRPLRQFDAMRRGTGYSATSSDQIRFAFNCGHQVWPVPTFQCEGVDFRKWDLSAVYLGRDDEMGHKRHTRDTDAQTACVLIATNHVG
ncbi:MAG: hypothetical protein AAFR75_07110, partial [Pseudomonadota bacterium]